MNLNQEQSDYIYSLYDRLKNNHLLSQREYGEDGYTSRDPFQRDYARILYSSSFRRLQGKMQILGINSAAFYRNRLTHSLEVAQIAKAIAYDLSKSCGKAMYYFAPRTGNIDLYCLEAAALSHDIGHPAFGHSGERALDEIARKYGRRFEGNAQNYRVLRTLEKYDPRWKGLNLTNRTLLAINKYIVREDGLMKEQDNKPVEKFMFIEDYNYLDGIRQEAGLLRRRTLDTQIVELADDIAYAVHDLEDALAYRSFNIDELLYDLGRKFRDYPGDEGFKRFEEIVAESKKEAEKSDSYKTLQEYSQVFRKKIVSSLTHQLVNDITLKEISEKEAQEHGTEVCLELSLDRLKNLCSILKKAIFECSTRDEDIMLYEIRGKIVIESLFKAFSDDQLNKNGKLLPPDYRNSFAVNNVQGSIDYIAGMMDTFAIEKYEELYCRKFSEIPV